MSEQVEGRPRCAKHGLALGPDARCVLCRRGAGGAPGRAAGGAWKPVVLGAALVAALVVGLAELRRRSVASVADGSADPRIVAEMRRVPIIVYGTRWCGHCGRARSWLSEHGYEYVVYDVEDDADARRAFLALNPSSVVPTIDVDGEVLVGFSPSDVERAIRERAEERLDL